MIVALQAERQRVTRVALGMLAVLMGVVGCSTDNHDCPMGYVGTDPDMGINRCATTESVAISWWQILLICLGAAVFGFFWLLKKEDAARRGAASPALRARRPGLANLYELLTGKRTDFDDLFVTLGLFERTKDGTVRRPADVRFELGDNADYLQFRPVPGTATRWESEYVLREMQHVFAENLMAASPTPGVMGVGVLHTPLPAVPDPLTESMVLSAVPPMDGWAVRVGIDSVGIAVGLNFANEAGSLVAGRTGSGKTASVQSILAPLLSSDSLAIGVLDGKGGGDWDCFEARCFEFLSTSVDLNDAARLLRAVENERIRRMAVLRERGIRNFWTLGPTPEMPLLLLIIDEADVFFVNAVRDHDDPIPLIEG